MKHYNKAKRPTRRQKFQIADAGLNPLDWLVVSATAEKLRIASNGKVREIGGAKYVPWR